MSVGTITVFRNCQLLRNHKLYRDELFVCDSLIIDPDKLRFGQKPTPDHIVDCNGAIISPGFIDLQIDGGFGVHFSFDIDKIEESLDKVAKGILAHGVTSFCPTLVSCQPFVYHHVLPYLKPKKGDYHGAEILGAHVEGPFISPGRRGAHDLEAIQTLPNGMTTVVDTYQHLDSIAMITLAPELDNATAVCQELSKRNIVVSLGQFNKWMVKSKGRIARVPVNSFWAKMTCTGHSMTGIADAERAVLNGASCITHLYNGMQTFQNRDPGLVGLLASDKIPEGKTVYYGLIADGHHAHSSTTRIAYRTHPEGVILVSDACSALGLPDGLHRIGEQSIDVKGTKALLEGTNTLVGGCAPLPSCIHYFWKTTDCTLVEALEAATLHPAKLMKIDRQKGTLKFGSDADFTILQPEDLQVLSTWIGGQCVYTKPN